MEHGLVGISHGFQTILFSHFQDQLADGGVKMHMMVAIDVIEGKSGVLEGLKLGPDFLF